METVSSTELSIEGATVAVFPCCDRNSYNSSDTGYNTHMAVHWRVVKLPNCLQAGIGSD